jgi:radical SAM protein (TIGR01212 family)
MSNSPASSFPSPAGHPFILEAHALAGTKPYRTYNQFLQDTFGCRVYKVSIDAGFTCPNIDGTKGFGGCTFCDETGSSSRTNDLKTPIAQQMLKNMAHRRKRFKAEKFIAYFQANTNTYAPVERLRRLYDQALTVDEDVVGLAISTRPDCVSPEILDLIASYKVRVPYVSVEYGLQSIHDRSLALVNRCERFADFLQAYEWTQARGLDHCIHVILGMPGETHADMMQTADKLAELKVAGVKIHLLVAMNHTPIAEDYRNGRWQSMDFDTYVNTCVDFIERLHPECVIHRVAGNGHFKHVVAPAWMASQRQEVMSAIDACFAQRGSKQGDACRF